MLTQNDLKNNIVFNKLDSLGLSFSEYVIMGSGIMFALGIRSLDELDDIDIYVTPSGWEKVQGLSEVIHDEEWNCDHIYLFDNQVEVYNGWGPSFYDIKELINNSYKVGNYNFASIEDVIKWKKELARDKDFKHIQQITDYLKKNPREIKMKLNESPFKKIKAGSKTVELRLFDEKRQLINTGDKIIFVNTGNPSENLRTNVIGISTFKNFEDLLNNIDPLKCGWEVVSNAKEMAQDMRKYYSDEDEKKYGVVGIHLILE
jgi:ASC-1-like (ASCH) protein